MDLFGILLKSYRPDLPYAERLLASFEKFATEPIAITVVVPDDDVSDFCDMVRSRALVMPESEWSHHLVDHQIHGNSPGYVNQEIIKMTFAEKEIYANYLCLDSEAVFIRPFTVADFMAGNFVPFTFVTEDSELRVDPVYEAVYGRRRDEYLVGLRDFLGLPAYPYKTCHGQAVLSSHVCNELWAFLQGRDMTWADALEVCPYEFSWYNFWLERSELIPRIQREPIFKTIHLEHQHLELAIKDIRESDMAHGYIGVVVNSGFSREHGPLTLDESLAHTLGRYVTERDLMRSLLERILRRMPRVRRLIGL